MGNISGSDPCGGGFGVFFKQKLGRRDRLFALGQAGYRGAAALHPKQAHDAPPVANTAHLKNFMSVREWSGKTKRMALNLLG